MKQHNRVLFSSLLALSKTKADQQGHKNIQQNATNSKKTTDRVTHCN